jgi:lysozyme
MIRRTPNGILVLSALLLLGTLYVTFDQGMLRLNYPSHTRFPVRGIDVSHHQGEIDWLKTKEDGIQFAFIKATEGGDYQDKSFRDNWAGAKMAGLKRGAYHFFTFCRPGVDQARNFLSVVPRNEAELSPVLDLEFGGNCQKQPSARELGAEVSNFITTVRPLLTGKPIYYVTPEFFETYLAADNKFFPDYTLWLRNVLYEPGQKICENWMFWQFADRARVKGIAQFVDLNVYCGSRDAFLQYIKAQE